MNTYRVGLRTGETVTVRAETPIQAERLAVEQSREASK